VNGTAGRNCLCPAGYEYIPGQGCQGEGLARVSVILILNLNLKCSIECGLQVPGVWCCPQTLVARLNLQLLFLAW
jgi:hypothetical protein